MLSILGLFSKLNLGKTKIPPPIFKIEEVSLKLRYYINHFFLSKALRTAVPTVTTVPATSSTVLSVSFVESFDFPVIALLLS